MPLASKQSLMIGGIAVAAACLAFLLTDGDTTVAREPSRPQSAAALQDAGDAKSSLSSPTSVRILVRTSATDERKPTPSDHKELQGDVLVAQYEHQGPIDPEVRDSFLRNCDAQIREIETRLAQVRDGSSSTVLLDEAGSFLRLITLRREKQALLTEAYLTTRPGSPQPPLSIPGAEVIQTGGQVEGKVVDLTYVFPLATDPELRGAREYRQAMAQFDESEKARRFNSLSDDERRKTAERLRQILRNPQRSQADNEFLFETIGFHSTLDEAADLVRLRPR